MSITTSFTFTDEFKDFLDATARKNGKTKTALLVEAVNNYSAGSMPESVLIEKLDTIAGQNAVLKDALLHRMENLEVRFTNLETLCIQILANQQKENIK